MVDITAVPLTGTLTQRAVIAASAGGDKIIKTQPNQMLLLMFKNTNASARTITIAAAVTSTVLPDLGPASIANMVLALNQNEEAQVLVPKGAFEDPADDRKIPITYSSEVGVELRAFVI